MPDMLLGIVGARTGDIVWLVAVIVLALLVVCGIIGYGIALIFRLIDWLGKRNK